jgi:hypothetical protein
MQGLDAPCLASAIDQSVQLLTKNDLDFSPFIATPSQQIGKRCQQMIHERTYV